MNEYNDFYFGIQEYEAIKIDINVSREILETEHTYGNLSDEEYNKRTTSLNEIEGRLKSSRERATQKQDEFNLN